MKLLNKISRNNSAVFTKSAKPQPPMIKYNSAHHLHQIYDSSSSNPSQFNTVPCKTNHKTLDGPRELEKGANEAPLYTGEPERRRQNKRYHLADNKRYLADSVLTKSTYHSNGNQEDSLDLKYPSKSLRKLNFHPSTEE